MPSEFPTNDPRDIWQNQPTEPFKMSTEEIRRKAQQHWRTARVKSLAVMIIGIYLSLCFAWTFTRVHEVVPRIGWGLLSFWGIYLAYQAYRWVWPGRLMSDAAASTSLEFYRSELERQRDFNQYAWGRAGLTFCFLGLALALVPPLIKSLEHPRLLLNFLPFLVLLIIWVASFPYIRKQKRQKLQQEIEQLRALEREAQP
jgi:hypothetical protein